jgi:tetratricopeptide (TPR) repeat protein
MQRLILLIGIMLIPFLALTQTWIEAPAEYKDAMQLVEEAKSNLQSGEVKKAEQLVKQALNIYPTHNFLEYIEQVFKLSDVPKASQLMDLYFERIKSFRGKEVVVNDIIYKKLTLYSIPRALLNYGRKMGDLNRTYSTASRSIKFLEKFSDLKLTDLDPKFDFGRSTQLILAIDLAVLKGKIDEAVDLANQTTNPPYYLAEIYMEIGDFKRALAEADKLKPADSAYAIRIKYIAYLMLNDSRGEVYWQQMEDRREAYVKKTGNKKTYNNIEFYALAIYDLHKNNFKSALQNLDKALNYRNPNDYGSSTKLVNRWAVYKSLGDAYLGLQQYDKARDNYNISLLSNPKYNEASLALKDLKSAIATQTATDKTPPVIKVTEPAVKRGLHVTVAANDILLRGMAMDPSGLKSVYINGQQVYAQSSGDFWGNIQLNEGDNKITIQATDGAGNISEQSFIIDRVAPATTNTDIIMPVTENEGKNYCVLIAAQDYKDARIPSLDNPIQDAVKLKIVLKNSYGFSDENIITLFNPEANDIKRKLLELTNFIQPEDNVLIFYAGHGVWVEKEKKGYWLMTDAKRNDSETWVSNKDILELVSKLPSRHTLLITDACFSGGVFKTRSIGKDASASIKLMAEKISRVAITSGNDTEVPDESVFMRYLVKALNENKEKYLTAQKMFITHIMEAVMTETKTEPRYGTLELAGHVGGDFIFVKK